MSIWNSYERIPAISRLFLAATFIVLLSCKPDPALQVESTTSEGVSDEAFQQELHEAFFISENTEDNEVRDVALDREDQVWVATAGGVFRKSPDSEDWISVITGEDRGPAYAVEVDAKGKVWLGTWNGLYLLENDQLSLQSGPEAPISVIAASGEEVYALGPRGIWQQKNAVWEKLDYDIAKSVRDAMTDGAGTLWVATDAGIYLCKPGSQSLIQSTEELISCYAKGLAFGPDKEIWAGVMGGVSIRSDQKLLTNLTPKEGIPSIHVKTIAQSPDGVMWIGMEVGVVRFYQDGTHSLLFSRRWLTDDRVNKVAFDSKGNAWIATENGLSHIKKETMTLKEKQGYFYSELMKKHMREPWICGVLRLEVPGDTSTWRNSDDDNDGEYTGGYLAMESFRYAVTKDEDALVKARKAFGFLKLLYDVTGTDGLFARTIVPTDWAHVHDPNRTYTDRELAEALVADPRYKPVEQRWRLSADKKWLWQRRDDRTFYGLLLLL